MGPLPPESVFSYGCWLTAEGPHGDGARVTIPEAKFVQAMVEACEITSGDVAKAISLIKAQVMAELRRGVS